MNFTSSWNSKPISNQSSPRFRGRPIRPTLRTSLVIPTLTITSNCTSSLTARKAESSDIQNLLSMLEEKADIEVLQRVADEKLDKTEWVNILSTIAAKANNSDIDILQSELKQQSNEVESFKQIYEKDLAQTKASVEDLKFFTTQGLNKKGEQRELDRMHTVLIQKIDTETYLKNTGTLR